MIILGLPVAVLVGGGIALWTPDKSRAELEAKYLVAPTDYVTVDGMRLHVRDSGPKDAPALIFLHGFASSLQTWDAWAKLLAPDYRVIRFDLPGSGLTGPDPTGDYTDLRTMQVLLGLMDKLDIGRATIILESLGNGWKIKHVHSSSVQP